MKSEIPVFSGVQIALAFIFAFGTGEYEFYLRFAFLLTLSTIGWFITTALVTLGKGGSI